MKLLLIAPLFLSLNAFALNAPTSFSASGNVQRCHLHWTDTNSSPNEDGTAIERSDDGGVNYVGGKRVGQDVVSFDDNNLTSGFTYWYRVRATALPGPVYSSYSSVDSCTPL